MCSPIGGLWVSSRVEAELLVASVPCAASLVLALVEQRLELIADVLLDGLVDLVRVEGLALVGDLLLLFGRELEHRIDDRQRRLVVRRRVLQLGNELDEYLARVLQVVLHLLHRRVVVVVRAQAAVSAIGLALLQLLQLLHQFLVFVIQGLGLRLELAIGVFNLNYLGLDLLKVLLLLLKLGNHLR